MKVSFIYLKKKNKTEILIIVLQCMIYKLKDPNYFMKQKDKYFETIRE